MTYPERYSGFRPNAGVNLREINKHIEPLLPHIAYATMMLRQARQWFAFNADPQKDIYNSESVDRLHQLTYWFLQEFSQRIITLDKDAFSNFADLTAKFTQILNNYHPVRGKATSMRDGDEISPLIWARIVNPASQGNVAFILEMLMSAVSDRQMWPEGIPENDLPDTLFIAPIATGALHLFTYQAMLAQHNTHINCTYAAPPYLNDQKTILNHQVLTAQPYKQIVFYDDRVFDGFTRDDVVNQLQHTLSQLNSDISILS